MSKLDYTEIKIGIFFKMNGTVYETVEATFSKKSRQKGSNQVKIKNIETGAVTAKTLHASDSLEDVDIEKKDFIFVYQKGNDAIIHPVNEPKNRISVKTGSIQGINLLPTNTKLVGILNDDKVLTIKPPIKVNLIVKEAPPNIRGNTTQGGSKHVIVETGAQIITPLFIEVGDVISIKTATSEYIERVQKTNS